jgi:hypothetical protein
MSEVGVLPVPLVRGTLMLNLVTYVTIPPSAGVRLRASTSRRLGKTAAADIVDEHNRRADPRAVEEAIGPSQCWALELLRDPVVILPEGAERAADALSVARGTAVRRGLNDIRAEVADERISPSEGAERVVRLVDELGLQPVALDDIPEPIDEDDLGVVCWMAVLPPH